MEYGLHEIYNIMLKGAVRSFHFTPILQCVVHICSALFFKQFVSVEADETVLDNGQVKQLQRIE